MMNRARGVTLIELLVVLALAGLILGMAVPALGRFVASNRNTGAVNRLAATLNYARSLSIRRRQTAVVCPIGNHQKCRPDDDWSDGWMVFIDADGGYPPKPDENEAAMHIDRVPAHTQVRSNRQVYVMRPFGKRSTNGTLTLCDRKGHRKTVIVSVTGRARVDRVLPDGSTPVCH